LITNTVKDYYDQVGQNYTRIRLKSGYLRLISDKERQFVLDRVPQGAKVLEIGPGSGFFTERLVQKASSVLAVDISDVMLETLQKRLNAENLTVVCGDITKLHNIPDFGNYDSVVCMRVLPHIENVENSIELIKNALNIKGNAIFDLWNDRSYLMVARRLRRSPSPVYTKYCTFDRMRQMISEKRLHIQDSWGWGYPWIGRLSLDFIGYKLLPQYAYSILFNTRRS